MARVTSKDLANFILYNSEKGISNLELQVLLNLITIDYEDKFVGKLLCDELTNFGRYVFKISDEVYWNFRNYGANSIDRPNKAVELKLSKKKIDFIIERIKYYTENGYFNNMKIIQEHNNKENDKKKLAKTHVETFIKTVWLCIPIFTLIALLKYIFG